MRHQVRDLPTVCFSRRRRSHYTISARTVIGDLAEPPPSPKVDNLAARSFPLSRAPDLLPAAVLGTTINTWVVSNYKMYAISRVVWPIRTISSVKISAICRLRLISKFTFTSVWNHSYIPNIGPVFFSARLAHSLNSETLHLITPFCNCLYSNR